MLICTADESTSAVEKVASTQKEKEEDVVTHETHSQYFERLWILVTGSLEKNSASPSTLVEFFKKSGLDRKMLREIWTASTTVNGVKHREFNRECFDRSLVLIAKAQNKDVPEFDGVQNLLGRDSSSSLDREDKIRRGIG